MWGMAKAVWACLCALRSSSAEDVASQPADAAQPPSGANSVLSQSARSIRAARQRLRAKGPVLAWRSLPRAWIRQAHTKASRDRTACAINPAGVPPCEECAVCLCKSRHLVAFGPCGHKFHAACLQKWASARSGTGNGAPSCPTCRSQDEWPLAPPPSPAALASSRPLRLTWNEEDFIQDLGDELSGWDVADVRHANAFRFRNCRVDFDGPVGARRMTRITCELTGTVELYAGNAGVEHLIRTIDHDTIETYAGPAGREFRTSLETGGFVRYYSGPEETLVRIADATTGQSVYSETSRWTV